MMITQKITTANTTRTRHYRERKRERETREEIIQDKGGTGILQPGFVPYHLLVMANQQLGSS